MSVQICPRCGQKQVRLDPLTGCLFCGRGNTLVYAPLVTDSTQQARTEPATGQRSAIAPPASTIGNRAPLRFTTLLTAAQTLHEQAQQTRARNAPDDANLIDATLVQLLVPTVQHLDGNAGWLRAARIVLDVATSAQIDALVSPAWSRAAVRMAALVVIPDIEQLASLDMAHAIIDAAIHIGAPAFNAGDARLCATVYWATALTLVEAPITQRSPRLTQALTPLRQVIAAPQDAIGDDEHALKDYAWKLRRALDETLRVR